VDIIVLASRRLALFLFLAYDDGFCQYFAAAATATSATTPIMITSRRNEQQTAIDRDVIWTPVAK
jgi:hypothetical protein